MSWTPLADIALIPLAAIVVGFGLLVIVPVVAIMTEHQRKMAKILRGQLDAGDKVSDGIVIGLHANINGKAKKDDAIASGDAVLDELRSMRGEIADLRMQVASLQGSRPPALPDDDVRNRLSQ